jgi:hypothetical protein
VPPVHPAGEASRLRGDGGGWVRRKPGKKLQATGAMVTLDSITPNKIVGIYSGPDGYYARGADGQSGLAQNQEASGTATTSTRSRR